ncbi:unnamed protein product [Didymodactylos carnosus]|uniref:Uncharacterized protein n=1 Tax=Didymodactylos carnosus TaxID=1234261 RepID=A0A815NV91_9BILA|nr:unnamed protein product [Didymodactylos carnosus]CAF1442993.1 unnamed protein product [Didymodactylos carnosus]CAF4066389.1 unnamed protein product [Didymodactylos carnosus]CAF4318516.1 unnamed protein product [Didymodactylos carnosus]
MTTNLINQILLKDLLEHAKRVESATTLTQLRVAIMTDTTEENTTAALQNFRPDGYYNRNRPRYDRRWPQQQNSVSYPQPLVQRQPGTSSSHNCHGDGHYSMDNISMSRSFKRVMVSHDGSATTQRQQPSKLLYIHIFVNNAKTRTLLSDRQFRLLTHRIGTELKAANIFIQSRQLVEWPTIFNYTYPI